MEIDHSADMELVSHYRADASAYFRQWVLWLGLGSAGAAALFLSLVANSCNPNFAFSHLVISFWLFLIGIICAAASLLAASFRSSSLGLHYAASHNREEANKGARSLPTVISAPQRIADEANVLQNSLIDRAKNEHEIAERAWKRRTAWHLSTIALLSISAGAFVTGVTLPLLDVSAGHEIFGKCPRK
jgi:hypothetical protein